MKRLLIVIAMLVAFASVAQAQLGSPFLSITDGNYWTRHTGVTVDIYRYTSPTTQAWSNVYLSSQRLQSPQVNASAYSWMADGPGAYQNQWYCVDLNSFQAGNIWNFYDTHQMTAPTGDPEGNYGTIGGLRRAAWLVDTYHDAANTSDLRAALQLAVWEAVYDGSDPTATVLNLDAGAFRAQNIGGSGVDANAILAKAQSYYGASAGKSGRGVYAVDGQNMLGRTEIPEPGTLILLGLGLTVAGFGIVRRRRQA